MSLAPALFTRTLSAKMGEQGVKGPLKYNWDGRREPKMNFQNPDSNA